MLELQQSTAGHQREPVDFEKRWTAFRRYKIHRVKIVRTPDQISFRASALSTYGEIAIVAVVLVLGFPLFGLSLLITSLFMKIGGNGPDMPIATLIFVLLILMITMLLHKRQTLTIRAGAIVSEVKTFRLFTRAQTIPLDEIKSIVAGSDGIVIWHGPFAIRPMNPGGYERSAIVLDGVQTAIGLFNPDSRLIPYS